MFTWLIWGITQGVATVGLWVGGGGIGAVALTLGTILILVVFIMSLFEGNKDVTRSDVVVLIIAFSAIGIWWFLDNPLIAILLVSAIDVLGYIPTFRKSYHHPWAETVSSWSLFVLTDIFAIIALHSYNFLTLSYLISISVINIVLVVFLLVRRQMIREHL